MPSRILRESYLTSASVAACPAASQDRLPRYWLAADDLGCFVADPDVLRGRLFPLRPDVAAADVASDLHAYAAAGMLEMWTDRGRACGFWRSWHRHQRARPGAAVRVSLPPSVAQAGGFGAYYAGDADRDPLPESAGICGNLRELPASHLEYNWVAGTSGNLRGLPASRARTATPAAAAAPASVVSEIEELPAAAPERAGPASSPAKSKPNAHARLLDHYRAEYAKVRGTEPVLAGPDKAALGKMLATLKPAATPPDRWPDLLALLVADFVRLGDKFTAENGWRLRDMPGRLNALLVARKRNGGHPGNGAARPGPKRCAEPKCRATLYSETPRVREPDAAPICDPCHARLYPERYAGARP